LVAQSSSDEDDSVRVSVTEDGKSLPFGFCVIDEKQILKGEWVRYQKRKMQFREVSTVSRGGKQFMCPKSVIQRTPSVIRIAPHIFGFRICDLINSFNIWKSYI
jgi:hypothetical protein